MLITVVLFGLKTWTVILRRGNAQKRQRWVVRSLLSLIAWSTSAVFLGLWIWSYRASIAVTRTDAQQQTQTTNIRQFKIESSAGGLRFSKQQIIAPPRPPEQLPMSEVGTRLLPAQPPTWSSQQHIPRYPLSSSKTWPNRFGFGAGYDADSSERNWLVFPWWCIVLPWTLLPLRSTCRAFARQRRIRLIRQGRCVKCGYDLRATTTRCPECGEPFTRANP